MKVHLIVTEESKTDLLHSVEKTSDMPKVRIDSFDLTEDEYLLFQDNQLSIPEILDDRFERDQLIVYIDE